MNTDFCIVVNTVSHCKDLWGMFFGQLEKHYPNNKIYVFTDSSEGLPEYCIPIIYNPKDNFRTQYYKCIQQVEEEFCLYLNEDYILYDDVDTTLMSGYVEEMRLDKDITFIKTNKGPNTTINKINNRDDLFYLNLNDQYFFSQNTAIWRTRTLEKIHKLGPDLHIANLRTNLQFEVEANKTCQELGLKGGYMYHNEPKRGKYHYDSKVFPYIATAIIKGKWNTKEYPNELGSLLIKYGIDEKIRGNNESI